jgi:hypothetical protein
MSMSIRRLALWSVCGLVLGCGEPPGAPIAKDVAPPPEAAAEAVKIVVSAPTETDNPINEEANLQVGQLAPDIVGSDFDGVAFKLSDYRGKVVVLDFWGDW